MLFIGCKNNSKRESKEQLDRPKKLNPESLKNWSEQSSGDNNNSWCTGVVQH